MKKINAFHIDMNNAQFTGEYLRQWLTWLAQWGYKQIIWEVEDNIQWETCPQCSSPDAFSKQEFKSLLEFCDSLGLESIPLLQTLGHCEYVLKQSEYKHMAELDNRVDQYCPLKDEVAEFLNRWIDEYLELFGEVNYFHLGADEAWTLGHCPQCKEYVQTHSLSQLYFQHLNKMISPLLDKGIRPIIWADTALKHCESIDMIDRRVALCDWMYDIYQDGGKIFNWQTLQQQKPGEISGEFKERFGKYIFPDNSDDPENYRVFYTSDYLCDLGFDVIGCPSSSAYGDTVFIPNMDLHLNNCFDFIKKGNEDKMMGWALTSWTCHLFPWVIQQACIELPAWIQQNPDKTLEHYRGYYVKNTFGIDDDGTFFKAVNAFADHGLLMRTQDLGIAKNPSDPKSDLAEKLLNDFEAEGKLDTEIQNTTDLIKTYTMGLNLFEDFSKRIQTGHKIMQWWIHQATCQLNRAAVTRYLLQNKAGTSEDNGETILQEMRQLRQETSQAYNTIIKPFRLQQMMGWLYDSCEYSMTKALKTKR